MFLEDESASRAFFREAANFLGDKRPLLSRAAVGRYSCHWRAPIASVHHSIEPYYVIAVVASFVVGAVGCLGSRFG